MLPQRVLSPLWSNLNSSTPIYDTMISPNLIYNNEILGCLCKIWFQDYARSVSHDLELKRHFLIPPSHSFVCSQPASGASELVKLYWCTIRHFMVVHEPKCISYWSMRIGQITPDWNKRLRARPDFTLPHTKSGVYTFRRRCFFVFFLNLVCKRRFSLRFCIVVQQATSENENNNNNNNNNNKTNLLCKLPGICAAVQATSDIENNNNNNDNKPV